MTSKVSIILLSSYFFTFLLTNFGLTYDRFAVQFFYLGILNVLTFSFLFYNFSFKEIFDISINSKPIIFYSLFILFSSFSIFVANNKPEAIIVFCQYFTFFLALIFINFIRKKSNINFVNLLIVFCIISLTLESFRVFFTAFDHLVIDQKNFTRNNSLYRGFAANINISAFSMVIKTPAILYLLDKKIKTHYKLLLSILLFTTVSCLFIFLSRASFIAFVFILLSYFLIRLIREQKINIVSTVRILLICITSYVYMSSIMNNDSSNIISDRVTSIGINPDDQSISQRLRYYNHSLKMISKNFLTGIGIGNWKIESIKYEAPNMSGYRVPYHAHNDFLQVFAESGIFAFLSFILLIIYPVKRIVHVKRINKEYIILCLMMGVYIIDSIFNFPIARPISHTFFLFLLVALTSKDLKNE